MQQTIDVGLCGILYTPELQIACSMGGVRKELMEWE